LAEFIPGPVKKGILSRKEEGFGRKGLPKGIWFNRGLEGRLRRIYSIPFQRKRGG